jgi:hypothetical protein
MLSLDILDNHGVINHLSSKHGITEVDYHRLKKPRLSIQRALTNLAFTELKTSTSETTLVSKVPLIHCQCTFGTIRPCIGSLDYWVRVTAEYAGRSSISNSY